MLHGVYDGVEQTENFVVLLRRSEVHDNLDESQASDKELEPVLDKEFIHRTKVHNSVQPSDVARLTRVTVHMDEIPPYPNAIVSGFDEALQDKEPAVGTVGADVTGPARKVAASRDSPYLSIMFWGPEARVDNIGYVTVPTGQIELLQKEGLHLMARARLVGAIELVVGEVLHLIPFWASRILISSTEIIPTSVCNLK
jgi:hypothetical protein